jgi:hypothetical protein
MDRKSVYILTDISLNTCGRVWEITAGERFEPRILKSFDLVTPEQDRDTNRSTTSSQQGSSHLMSLSSSTYSPQVEKKQIGRLGSSREQ